MGHYDLELIDHTYAIPVSTIRHVFPHLSPPEIEQVTSSVEVQLE